MTFGKQRRRWCGLCKTVGKIASTGTPRNPRPTQTRCMAHSLVAFRTVAASHSTGLVTQLLNRHFRWSRWLPPRMCGLRWPCACASSTLAPLAGTATPSPSVGHWTKVCTECPSAAHLVSEWQSTCSVRIGALSVLRLGSVECRLPSFHTLTHVFPVGFASARLAW